jgi:hypothetical protein
MPPSRTRPTAITSRWSGTSRFPRCASVSPRGPALLSEVHDAVDVGQLDETFADALCNPVEVFTYRGMIARVLTFAAHRRASRRRAEEGRPRRPGLGRSDEMGRRVDLGVALAVTVAPALTRISLPDVRRDTRPRYQR